MKHETTRILCIKQWLDFLFSLEQQKRKIVGEKWWVGMGTVLHAKWPKDFQDIDNLISKF